MIQKFAKVIGNEVFIGKLFSDGSRIEMLKLYTDNNNIFQIEFLHGTNDTYSFLPECKELLNVLVSGIAGVKTRDIGKMLAEQGIKCVVS